MNVLPLPAFSDNYIWLLHNGQHAVVVDPGDAAPVRDALNTLGLELQAIVLTHHHGDHIGGVSSLHQHSGCKVYGPAQERLPAPAIGGEGVIKVEKVDANTRLHLLGLAWQVLPVPGHTAGHIAWFTADLGGQPAVFCGDTLFSAGCGRLFEGTAAQMHTSLQQLAALPAHTHVFCAHEYTLSNIRFALAVEPDNAALQQYQLWCQKQRDQGLPTLPSTIGQELAINPFLRCQQPAVARAAQGFAPATALDNPISVLAALREWKNVFA